MTKPNEDEAAVKEREKQYKRDVDEQLARTEFMRSGVKRAELRGIQKCIEALRSDKAAALDYAGAPMGLSPEEWADWLEQKFLKGEK